MHCTNPLEITTSFHKPISSYCNCTGIKLCINAIKVITIKYFVDECHCEIDTLIYKCPIFEVIPFHCLNSIHSICDKISFCYSKMCNKKTIYVYSIISILVIFYAITVSYIAIVAKIPPSTTNQIILTLILLIDVKKTIGN